MSWFADLAGKAENFLNKVDQGAASALNNAKDDRITYMYDSTETLTSNQYATSHHQPVEVEHQTQVKASYISSAADKVKQQKVTILAGTANMIKASKATSDITSLPASSNISSNRPSSHFVRPKKSEPDDDVLFNFLNSSEKPLGGKVDSKKDKVKAAPSESHSRNSSISSISTSTLSIKTTEDASTKDQGHDTPESSDSGLSAQGDIKEDASISTLSNQIITAKDDSQSHELSNLRLENQLLRNEVQSLNQEMASLIQRSNQTQEELKKARTRIEAWNAENSKSDRVARELQAQVDDLSEAMAAKDSQLAVLKVRLEEADQLVKSRTDALERLQSERSRILQDHNEGSTLQNQAMQTLQERLREAEASVKREQESYKQMQSEFTSRLSKMEAERQSLAEAVNIAERKCVEDKRRADDLQQQLKGAKASLETAKQELVDYKQKATRILQSKEKLINSLKEGASLEGLDSHAASSMELEELRHERDMQREEMQRLLGQIQQLRAELQDVESQQIVEAESAREQLQELQEQIAAQTRAKQEAEAEFERQKQEFQYMEEEMHRTKTTLQSRIKDREEEIQKLRNQLTNKALSNSSQTELENRLHQLTETLIQKQTMLEALGTEKNSLVFQLERLEQQLKTVQGNSVNGSSINMSGIDSGEGARMRSVPVLFSDTETNTAGMYGKVRKAASTIDRFSIRLGIFLRRYPIIRVFIIIYMALLHLWVMIVLLTYTPEMHHDYPGGN
ncbi:golgin subfamily A member 5 [Latimeria chalumnae]|uniref:Golgin subfamily A member 5 n=1 Tax=Latimeria chalumnae TaxID=7897 RepID=H3BIG9_LATCH|nr:PREDICTED: golgin subfamily A member 5 [Latimeria chalumnae]XP_005986664.1 PREDICTED: golgin subfamily A member 5 [Latimeria chalumnae]XP_005986665.1 PREDICTED: golgin subfamily A member 5 [Latimeria chalumnae]XP_005986666.1 PREDICTED: golgin subfamily A member 5 [Latimeria chalumnae]|eukprot:XP_005986663.1 PREDICTED: golgin subfamily A member 5 [Latimeria chalumnae]